MTYTFGPVNSRRFGLSLGIDLSPEQKSCNFDCLYCELEPAKPVEGIHNPPKVEDVVAEVKKQLARFENIDVLTITANGEPTLYPNLDELIDELQKIKGDAKLLILSNASRIHEEAIQKALAKLDIVKLSLDCATPRCFRRLDRPLKGINIETIIEGMVAFRKRYSGLLVVEILVVAGINDKEEEFAALNEALQRIQPDRIDIGTIDRPPAYKVEPVSYQRLFELSQKIKNFPITIVSRHNEKNKLIDLSETEILHLLSHRPLTQSDVKSIFTPQTQKRFNKLLQNGEVKKTESGGLEFYRPTS